MRIKRWQAYAAGIMSAEAVGIIAGLLTREDTRIYAESVVKPALAPPGWVFPAAWTLLYALMGIGAAGAYLADDSPQRGRALWFYGLQLFLNFCWCFIFFSLQAFGVALIWLLILFGSVLLMTLFFYRLDKTAGLLQVPYLLWLSFALYLNWGVWTLN